MYTCEMMIFKFIEDSKLRSNVTFTNYYSKEQVEGFNRYQIKPVRKLNEEDFHPFKLGLESHSAFAYILWFLYNISTFMKPFYKSIVQNVLTENSNDQEKTIFVKFILSRLICYYKFECENKCQNISLKETEIFFANRASRKCKKIVLVSEIVESIIHPSLNNLQILYGYLLKQAFPETLRETVTEFVKFHIKQYPYKFLDSNKYNNEWVRVISDVRQIEVSEYLNVSSRIRQVLSLRAFSKIKDRKLTQQQLKEQRIHKLAEAIIAWESSDFLQFNETPAPPRPETADASTSTITPATADASTFTDYQLIEINSQNQLVKVKTNIDELTKDIPMNEHANLKNEIHQMEANKEVSISLYNKIDLRI